MAQIPQNVQREMADIYKEATAGTPFEDVLCFSAMSILYEHNSLPLKELNRKVSEGNTNIKDKHVDLVIRKLKKLGYLVIHGLFNKTVYPTKIGIDTYIKSANNIGELSKSSSQGVREMIRSRAYGMSGSTPSQTRIRKSRIQEYNDYTGYDPRYLSLWYPEVSPIGLLEK